MKKILATFLFLCMVMPLCITASAHSGRTDGDGGHWDQSTGEYHYHHGYPAHDHYDMDGDGDIDCPYDFRDGTANAGGTRRSAGSKSTIYSYISLGFVVLFFILVNCLAIRMDISDPSSIDEPMTLPSVFVSIFSTLIVFFVLFCIMYFSKEPPLALREMYFKDMIQAWFLAAIIGGLVWLISNGLSLWVNTMLCKLFKTEVCGWFGAFQRLTIPLSYAFAVLLLILE